jgi:mono/diheme cytochrome c family protein
MRGNVAEWVSDLLNKDRMKRRLPLEESASYRMRRVLSDRVNQAKLLICRGHRGPVLGIVQSDEMRRYSVPQNLHNPREPSHKFRFVLSSPFRLDTAPVNWQDHEMQSVSLRPKRRSVSSVYRSASDLSLVGLFFLASAMASLVTAQTSTPRRTVWDGVYTEAQAARGATAFGQSCSGCHVLAPEGKAPLVGDAFWKSFAQKTVGDLLEFVSTYMPNGNPGSLTEPTYRDIVALMLKSNGFPPGTAELGGTATADVQIVPKDGSTQLPANALARVVGCLGKSGPDWVVTKATAPERAERVVSAGEDATRPLGSRQIALKFVVTKLDGLAGSRVVVSGLLIGEGGVDGLNVTTVNRVAPKCP